MVVRNLLLDVLMLVAILFQHEVIAFARADVLEVSIAVFALNVQGF